MNVRRYAPLVAVLVLGAVGIAAAGGYVHDAAERVKAADWSKMQTVKVTLKEYAFSPSTLVFKAGVPYKLVITNEGTMKHYFTAEEFFKAIATRKVQSTDGEVKAPYFRAIEVYPGRSMELFFIPVKKGLYGELRCTIPGHVDLGMRGQIRIE